jgi:hypothetical protein
MKLDLYGTIALGVVVLAATTCAIFEQKDFALFLGGLATGLLAKFGAVGGPKSGPPTAVLAVLALLLAGCAPAVLVADDTLTEVCDAAGDEIDAEHERGELTTEQAECAVLGVRRACLEIHDRLVSTIDEEE